MPLLNKPEFLNEDQAAEFLGVKPQTLALWRCTKRYALPYLKIGSRFVRYDRRALEQFIQANTVGAPEMAMA